MTTEVTPEQAVEAAKKAAKAMAVAHESPGRPLSDDHLSGLERSYIPAHMAEQAMLRSVTHIEALDLLGKEKGNGDYSGLAIPYVWPGEDRVRSYRVRRDHAPVEPKSDGTCKVRGKYEGPAGRVSQLYLVPGTYAAALQDAAMPVVITEGEKKTIALYHMSKTLNIGLVPCGLAGVWNFRGTIGKAPGAKGERISESGVIPDFDRLDWGGRTVYIVFDCNVRTNASVAAARRELSLELLRRGAKVFWVTLPYVDGINGVDDLLGLWGPDRVWELFEQAVGFMPDLKEKDHPVGPKVGDYQMTQGGIIRWEKKRKQKDDATDDWFPIKLTNFTARIRRQRIEDDGLHEIRHFDIEVAMQNVTRTVSVLASEFDRMEWVSPLIGANAVVFPTPNAREHLRAAIKLLSGDVQQEHTYGHTGWREIDGKPHYLHLGGAIGPDGVRPDVRVKLPAALSGYRLPSPPADAERSLCVRASIDMWKIAPDQITIPVHAAVVRAPLCQCDTSIFIAGQSGSGKTELSARAQQHYGPTMDREHLPTCWEATANANEKLAHRTKDAVIVIDDWVPQSGVNGQAANKAADRLVRGQGNQSGRQRLGRDQQELAAAFPRGIIISTGEDVPQGQSLVARMSVVHVSRGDIKFGEVLSESQRAGSVGLYAGCMAAYIGWLARNYDAVQVEVKARREEFRQGFYMAAVHQRTPDNLANLAVGEHMFLRFALECGAITAEEHLQLWHRVWNALVALGAAQKLHQAVNDPAQQFITLIGTAIVNGQAYLTPRNGTVSPDLRAWGWSSERGFDLMPKGALVGWLDGTDVYLHPESAYAVAKGVSNQMQLPFATSTTSLWKRLREKGILATWDEKRETNTVRRRFDNRVVQVLHIPAAAFSEPDTSGTQQQPNPTRATHRPVLESLNLAAGTAEMSDMSGFFNNTHKKTYSSEII